MNAGDDVTASTYIPPDNVDEHMKLFMKCLKLPDSVPDGTIPDYFSIEDYVHCWYT